MERTCLENMPVTNHLSFYTSTGFTLITAAVHYVMYRVSLEFLDVFEGFGAELPTLTQILIHPGYYWSVPILTGCAFLAHQMGYLGKVQTVLFGSALSLGSIPLCIIGFYLPIFQMGSVVTS